jgi:glycosyltransferase involved in cell wall biosynthesis
VSVGFVVYALDRNPGGIGQYTRGLLAGLQRIGCEPLVLQAGRVECDNGTVPLPGAGLLPGLLTLGQLQIRRAVQRHNLTLVHDPTGTAPLMLCPSKRVVTLHDVFPLSFPGHSAALEALIYRFWLPYAVRHVDAIITDSRQSKSDIHKYLYILYVGSIEPRKNLLRLLEAYARLREWSPKWKLVIVGARNYWKSSPVAQAVERMGLQGQVKFTGYVPDEDLPALYNGADLFCFPSLYEGFGLPVLEAMACGTPVVTSNTSSLPEVAGEAALLVDPYDVEAIAAAMRRVLEDP